jgi:hypothetical protein
MSTVIFESGSHLSCVGRRAFSRSSLSSIRISSSVTRLCEVVSTSVDIFRHVHSNLLHSFRSLHHPPFPDVLRLHRFALLRLSGATLLTIESRGFHGCSRLKSIDLPIAFDNHIRTCVKAFACLTRYHFGLSITFNHLDSFVTAARADTISTHSEDSWV